MKNLCPVILLISMVYFVPAEANEKFVLTAAVNSGLTVRIYELNGNQMKILNTANISAPAISTAVTFRKNNGVPTFYIYYSNCFDFDCFTSVLSMKKLDSNLNVVSSEDDLIGQIAPANFDLAAERVTTSSGTSLKLLLNEDFIVAHRTIAPRGLLSSPQETAFVFDGGNFDFTAAPDGTMAVAWLGNTILLHPIHPSKSGKSETIQPTNQSPANLVLTGSITPLSVGASVAEKFRLLFYRTFPSQDHRTQLMMQRIDDARVSFIGRPKVVRSLSKTPYVNPLSQSIAVTTGGSVVFYADYDKTCGKNVLKAQVLDPESGKNIGKPQVLIGCDQALMGFPAISVSQF